MDDVTPDQQRDAEAALLDGDALQLVDGVDVDDVDNRPDSPGTQVLAQVFRGVAVACLDLRHLPDFLGQGHLAKQGRGALCRALLRVGLYCFGRTHR